MYRCFSVSCLFENFSLNFPLLSRLFYFLKKEINLTLSSLTHTFIANTHWLICLVHTASPLFWIPFLIHLKAYKPEYNSLETPPVSIPDSPINGTIYLQLFFRAFWKFFCKAKPSPCMNLKFIFTIHFTVP